MTKETKRSDLWIKKTDSKGKILKKNSFRKTLLLKDNNYVGIHLIAEFWNGKNIEDSKKYQNILIKAAKEAKCTPLKVVIHKFLPQGITGVVLLSESHIALHSWPEIDYLAIDIFTCGDKMMPYQALKYLKKEFQPKKVEIKEVKRGRTTGR